MVKKIVLSRAKAIVVIVIALAILYVLISPLPEMAATSSTQTSFCFVLWLFPLFTFSIAPFTPVLFGNQLESGLPLDRSLLCTRLCSPSTLLFFLSSRHTECKLSARCTLT